MERTFLRQLDKVQLLALLRPRDMGGDEGVHERLKIGSPPLSKAIADFPVMRVLLVGQLSTRCGRETLVELFFEGRDLVAIVREIVSGTELLG